MIFDSNKLFQERLLYLLTLHGHCEKKQHLYGKNNVKNNNIDQYLTYFLKSWVNFSSLGSFSHTFLNFGTLSHTFSFSPDKNIPFNSTTCSREAWERGQGQKVIGFSFFSNLHQSEDDTKIYAEGVAENLRLLTDFYPGNFCFVEEQSINDVIGGF